MNNITNMKKLMESIDNVNEADGIGQITIKKEIYGELKALMQFVQQSNDVELLREVLNEILDAQMKLGQTQQNDRF